MRGAASLVPWASVFASILAGCSPELGDVPFACSEGDACPEGYACQSAVCVREGTSLEASHPKRVTWINAGEMFWLESKTGGAVLIVNDGFSPGAHGIYEIRVAPDGALDAPKPLLSYGDQFPIASSVVTLSDGRYGVTTLSFPSIDDDTLTLKVLGIERETPAGAAPSIETLYTDEEPYLGGTEPAYVSAVAGSGTLDLAWTRPTQGGRVEVIRLERQGAVWKQTLSAAQQLPPEVLPLSGDCLLWKTGENKLMLRVGFEGFAVASVDIGAPSISSFTVLEDVPLYAWEDKLLLLRYGALDEESGSLKVSYVLSDLTGKELAVDDGGVLQEPLEPYTALPYNDGAIFAPLSADPTFPELGVAWRSPSQGLTKIATVKRQSADRIYSARAFASGGKAYLAWTEFHESLMDLWVAVADLSAPTSAALLRPPERVATWQTDLPMARPKRGGSGRATAASPASTRASWMSAPPSAWRQP